MMILPRLPDSFAYLVAACMLSPVCSTYWFYRAFVRSDAVTVYAEQGIKCFFRILTALVAWPILTGVLLYFVGIHEWMVYLGFISFLVILGRGFHFFFIQSPDSDVDGPKSQYWLQDLAIATSIYAIVTAIIVVRADGIALESWDSIAILYLAFAVGFGVYVCLDMMRFSHESIRPRWRAMMLVTVTTLSVVVLPFVYISWYRWRLILAERQEARLREAHDAV